jgi:hypothetical protein
MINPSINGWIDKFFTVLEKQKNDEILDSIDYYTAIRKTGLIYGHAVSFSNVEEDEIKELSIDEITKIVFLDALYGVFRLKTKSTSKEAFLKTANSFYKAIQKNNYLFLKKLLPETSDSLQLESVINDRIQTNQNVVSKNFSHIVTNALLFLDVLAFYHFIENTDFSKKYFETFEKRVFQIICMALDVKKIKTHADELLLKLFENSLRYSKSNNVEKITIEEFNYQFITNDLEKFYFFDLVQMALLSDVKLDENEYLFLNYISEKLTISDTIATESISNIRNFIKTNRNNISYFNHSNPVKHFYNQTNATVIKLITRNKKRLTKEIVESKELMILLAKSTTKDLDDVEKKKVKKQLLDICKTIPSLTIFLLPGGGILLPILVKYIPQLLPSAFNENLDE